MAKRGGGFVYHEADSPFHRLHPAAKLLYVVASVTITFTLQHPIIILSLFILSVFVAYMAHMSRTMTMVFVALVGTGALMSALTWLPFGGDVGEQLISIPLVFGIELRFTDLGLLWAPAMGLRILSSSLPLFVLLSATKPRDLTIGLSTLGMPHEIGTLFVMALRFVPLVQNDAAIIVEAQRARGLDLGAGSARERTRKYTAILAPLIFSSLRRIQLVANALDTKGFRSKVARHRYYKRPMLRWSDVVVIALSIAATGFAIYARTIGWGIIIPSRL